MVKKVSFLFTLYISRQFEPAIPSGLLSVMFTSVADNPPAGITMVEPALKFCSLSPGLAFIISDISMLYFRDMEYSVSLAAMVWKRCELETAGMMSFCPTDMLSLIPALAFFSVPTLMLYIVAMPYNVSPGFTMCSVLGF